MRIIGKFVYIIAFVALAGLLSAGCASQREVNHGGMTLDRAIADAAARIDERIAAGSKIALLNFSSPSDRFSLYVLDELSANLLDSGRLTVVDRREVDLIRGEFDFLFSGEVGDESMQSMGQMLGAQSIVSGSLTEIGGDYRIAIRVLNVQSAAIEVHFRSDIANDRRVQALLEGGRTGAGSVPQWLAAAQTPTAQPVRNPTPAAQAVQPPVGQAPVQAQPAAPPAPVFRIGDTGPAGGIIFFDQGNNSGGWRFMEAAPVDLGPVVFATEGISVNEIQQMAFAQGNNERRSRALGTGFSNTEHLTRIANNRGGGFGWAVRLAATYELNGFDDWFLPSQDELNHMYGNLHMRGLGNFRAERYWSSSMGTWGTLWGTRTVAQYINFSNGEVGSSGDGWIDGSPPVYLEARYLVRPVRRF